MFWGTQQFGAARDQVLPAVFKTSQITRWILPFVPRYSPTRFPSRSIGRQAGKVGHSGRIQTPADNQPI
jgi:hypothetical protein